MTEDNRLLMSDSLRGVVPELEEDIAKKLEDTIVVVSFVLSRGTDSEIASGVLVGASVEERIVKADFRLDTSDAYRLFSAFIKDNWRCDKLYMDYAGDYLEISGPFQVSAPKLSDIDRQLRTCTIGIDLIRI